MRISVSFFIVTKRSQSSDKERSSPEQGSSGPSSKKFMVIAKRQDPASQKHKKWIN